VQALERTILHELFADKDFAERVIPYIRPDYFQSNELQAVYTMYAKFYDKFKSLPQFSVIRIGLDSTKNLTDKQVEAAHTVLNEIEAEPDLKADQKVWLLENTEEFCQDRALYLALQESIKVMHDTQTPRHVIPDLMKAALAINFDQHIGHDYFADAEARYEYYHRPEERIPFDVELLNRMTKGGLPRKTLNIVLAGTNIGKSLLLCHCAAANLRMNKNVLYITLEMAEERIAERIDANMMNIPLDDLEHLPRADYVRKIHHLRDTSKGRLVIKEYPTSAAHAGHFGSLLKELEKKQNFKPDIIYIDYLTICASSRMKLGGGTNSFSFYKSVAEELRSMAVEFNVPVFTATQFNRQGFGSGSDADITNVGESFAIPQTADFMFALTQTEELERLGQVTVQPMKNRYQKRNSFAHELLGLDTPRMRVYDLNASQVAQSQAATAQAPSAPAHQPYRTPNAFKGKSGGFKSPFKSLRDEGNRDDE